MPRTGQELADLFWPARLASAIHNPGLDCLDRSLSHEFLLQKSEQNNTFGQQRPHTIVRTGKLTDGPGTGDIFVAEGGDTLSGTIPREDVAKLLVSAFLPLQHRTGPSRQSREMASVEGLVISFCVTH